MDTLDKAPKGPIAWMAGNTVAATLLMLVLVIGGLTMGLRMKQEIYPDFIRGTVDISVSYPGASPEEVERGVILAVEEAVQGLDGVDEIQSTASEGSARVRVEAVDGADITELAANIKSEVDAIQSFPEEAEDPMVSVGARRREVISYALYGDVPDTVLREKAEELRDVLLQDPAITQIELTGIREFEIQVEVSQANLRRYGLTLEDVADEIRRVSVELPGGSLETEGGEVLVRMKERRDVAVDYAQIPIIAHADGSRVLLGDIAKIREGFSESKRSATFNGQPAIMIEVYRVGDQTPVEVADAVKARIADYQAGLPEGIRTALVGDSSDAFKQRSQLLLDNGYIGLALVFFFLALFLEIRLAFWVSLCIPISILGSFLFLPLTDFSINMMSMFAFIVTLGIMVDTAIVVGENIYQYRQLGMPAPAAAWRGARDMAMPVTFAILTNIVSFIPLYFVPGGMGQVFRIIPVVVIVVFVVSLVECLFILPSQLANQKEWRPGGVIGWLVRGQQRFGAAFSRFVTNVYGPFIDMVLRRRYTAISIGLAVIIITGGYVASGRMGMVLFPSVESDFAFVTATMPYGVADSRTEAVRQRLVEAAGRVVDRNGGEALSTGIYAQVDENVITVRVFLTPPEVRPVATSELTDLWRREVGEIPGLESLNFESDRGGPGSGKNLTVELSHRNIDILDAAGRDLAEDLSFFPMVKDIDDGSARGKRQYDFQMRPEGERMGFRSRDVARQVRDSFFGADALKLQRGRNEVTVTVRLPKEERVSEYALEDLVVRAPDGAEALLRDVVTMEGGRAYTTITRRQARRTISVTANVLPRSEANRVIDTIKAGILPELNARYPGLTYSFQGRQADMQESIASLITGLLLALVCIYALLAIPFRSFIQGLIIMVSVPFGFFGVVVGHLLMGYSLSVMSLFGMVAVSGVVVNAALVLIHQANCRRADGLKPSEAIRDAGITRFRPIILTTLTTFAGLAPMIFETSRQARFMIPMAISLGFGVVFSTLITLILVPTLYMVMEDARNLFRKEEEETEAPETPLPVYSQVDEPSPEHRGRLI